jgi:hypothetical protein
MTHKNRNKFNVLNFKVLVVLFGVWRLPLNLSLKVLH